MPYPKATNEAKLKASFLFFFLDEVSEGLDPLSIFILLSGTLMGRFICLFFLETIVSETECDG